MAANLIIGKDDPGPVIVATSIGAGTSNLECTPTALLNKELVDPEDPDDSAITKERNRGILNATLKKLNESSSRR